MDKKTADLPKKKLLEKMELQEKQIMELTEKVNFYEEQIREARKQRFGRKTEQVPKEQLSFMGLLFNEAEALYDQPTENTTEDKNEQSKRKHGQNAKHITRGIIEIVRTVEHKLDTYLCDKCGGPIKVIDNELVFREIIYIPGHYEMVLHTQEVGVCQHCNDMREDKYDENGFVKAKLPNRILPKSTASPSLLAKIINDKYSKSLPLYRQEKEYEEKGLDLTRQTMSNWIIRLNELYLEKIVEHMRKRMMQSKLILVDETPVETIHHPDKEPSKNNSYMWVARTGPLETIPVVIYQYEKGRNYIFAQEILKGYENMVQADGYQAYDQLSNERIGCWSHLRRKFVESLDAMPSGVKKEETNAFTLRVMIDKMFSLENKVKNKSAEERKAFRMEKTKEIMDEFFEKVHSLSEILEVAPTTQKFKTAIEYAINQEESVRKVLEHGEADFSSNAVERVIRNFTIGRSNWMFFNTVSGGQASASIYSIIVTAKENGLKSYNYLEYLFSKLPDVDMDDEESLEKLMPWYEGLPENIKRRK